MSVNKNRIFLVGEGSTRQTWNLHARKPRLPTCDQDSAAPGDPGTSPCCYTTVVRDGSVSERHMAAAISHNKTKASRFALKMQLNACDLKVRYCVPWPNIMQPVSGGSTFSHLPTHELWVAGRLTSLDTGESAWVEREQPWEQCPPATLETCQPPFQLKSQNHAVLYCNPARPLQNSNRQKMKTSLQHWWSKTRAGVSLPKIVAAIHQNYHLCIQLFIQWGLWAARVPPKVPLCG